MKFKGVGRLIRATKTGFEWVDVDFEKLPWKPYEKEESQGLKFSAIWVDEALLPEDVYKKP
jgi:hypothetical protein